MAVAMGTIVQQQHQSPTVTDLNKFLVPKILSVNLKAKPDESASSSPPPPPQSQQQQRQSTPPPTAPSARVNDGQVNTNPIVENVRRDLSRILTPKNRTNRQTDRVSPVADEPDRVDDDGGDVIGMAPERHRDKGGERQSSYLLQPFLKPVAQHVEGSPADNPILRALFGGNNNNGNINSNCNASSGRTMFNWVSAGDRPATNNCHPFKRTELSHDILHDPTPVQVPKSLARDRVRSGSTSHLLPVSVCEGSRQEDLMIERPAKSAHERAATPKMKVDKENAKPLIETDSKPSLSKLQSSRCRISSLGSLRKVGYVNSEKLMKLRAVVDNAIKNHKVYSMTGCYNSVRNALKQRGWIEKIDSDIKGKRRQNRFEEIEQALEATTQSLKTRRRRLARSPTTSTPMYSPVAILSLQISISMLTYVGDDAAFQFVQKYPTLAAMRYSIQSHSGFSHNDQINYSGQGEAEIINRMLRNINEDLCWLSRPYPYYCWKEIGKFDMVNRLPKAYFSNKIGLCNSLQHIQWYFEPGVCSTQYPRTYNMSQKEEYDAFRDDFRMTACIGLLKWLTINYRSGGEKAVRSADGKVDVCVVDFALKRCTEYVKYREHEDIDVPDGSTVWEYQWEHFINQYYKIINDGHLLKECKTDPSIQVYVTNALAMLNIIKAHWPQINIDGYQNYWVVKPGGRCCGNGIVIKNNLEQILMMVNPSSTRETRYVVQKYIERPLLIYNTKFDIRQWFLVTSVYPLTVWMYKESYLRFCSQPFSLKSTHESIHLCNNAVQRRYKNSKRDKGLPDENMWDCYTFQTYLKSVGHPDAWEKYIYPGMKEGFIGALLASQDTMERRKNCFELYGADFMISDTLTDGPWLIEINSNPAMDSSTSVTARMCPQVLEDIVKVVIDRRDDKNASTGAFEMVFKQHCPPVPPYLGMSLSIKGQKVNRGNGGEVAKPCTKKSKSPTNSSGKFLQSEEADEEDETAGPTPDPADPSPKEPGRERSGGTGGRSISPVVSSKVLEALKKDLVCAQLSVHMIHTVDEKRKHRLDLAARPGDLMRAVDDDCFMQRAAFRSVKTRKAERKRIKKAHVQKVIKTEVSEEEGETEVEEETNRAAAEEEKKEEQQQAEEKQEQQRKEEEELNEDKSAQSIYEIPPEEFLEVFKDAEETVEEEMTSVEEVDNDQKLYIVKERSREGRKRKEETKEKKSSAFTRRASGQARHEHKKRCKPRQIPRRRVDYVRKNIEDVRVMNEGPMRGQRIGAMPWTLKLQPYRIPQCVPGGKGIANPVDFEVIYKEELIKMLHTMDSKKFIKQLCGKKGKYWSSYLQMKNKEGAVVVGRRAGVDVFKRDGENWRENHGAEDEGPRHSEVGSLQQLQEANSEIPPICSEIAVQLALTGVGSSDSSTSLVPRESFSRFEAQAEDRLTRTGRFQADWRADLEAARRACEERLMKLLEFTELDSKVRSREALTGGRRGKDHRVATDRSVKDGRKHFAGLPDSGLAVSTENGVVRRVDRRLPKIHRRGLQQQHVRYYHTG